MSESTFSAHELEILAHAEILSAESPYVGRATSAKLDREARRLAHGREAALAEAALGLLLGSTRWIELLRVERGTKLSSVVVQYFCTAIVGLAPPRDFVARVGSLLPAKAAAALAYADRKASDPGPWSRWSDLMRLITDRRIGSVALPVLRRLVETPELRAVMCRVDLGRGVEVLAALARHDAISDEELVRLCHENPYLARWAVRDRSTKEGADAPPSFVNRLRLAAQDAAWERAIRFDERDIEFLEDADALSGTRFVVRAAEVVRDAKLKRLRHPCRTGRSSPIEAAAARLASAALPDGADRGTRDALLGALSPFPPRVLELLLPVASGSRPIVCEALGWTGASDLVGWIARTSRLDPLASWEVRDIPSSSDPSVGVVSPLEVRRAAEEAGETTVRAVIACFEASNSPTRGTMFLLRAALGWNRTEVEEKLAKRNQVALRAYALLPLGDEGETFDRYLRIKQFEKEASRFGPERQQSETGAARAALTNLALNAGYSDATRLEWAMEARKRDGTPTTWQTSGCVIELVVKEGEPRLVVRDGRRTLRSVPAALKKDPRFLEAKTTLAANKAQRARLRATFERMMVSRDAIRRSEIESLTQLPIAEWMLRRLVLVDEAGMIGVLPPAGMGLLLLDGTTVPFPREVRFAHALDLVERGVLSGWRAFFLRANLTQPFKQVFRETYTPVALEGQGEVTAFEGKQVDTRIATRLLQSRGWESGRDDVAQPFRAFREVGIRAEWTFPDAGHFLAELPQATTGALAFRAVEGGKIPIDEVDPVVYSEALRDADLVTSVAAFDVHASPEAVQYRSGVIQAIVEIDGLKAVELDREVAIVQGSLARYRVRLSDGRTTVEPIGVALDLPSDWGHRRGKRRWPFGADEGDDRTFEILGRVLLLSEDHRIQDRGVLAQIHRLPRG